MCIFTDILKGFFSNTEKQNLTPDVQAEVVLSRFLPSQVTVMQLILHNIQVCSDLLRKISRDRVTVARQNCNCLPKLQKNVILALLRRAVLSHVTLRKVWRLKNTDVHM